MCRWLEMDVSQELWRKKITYVWPLRVRQSYKGKFLISEPRSSRISAALWSLENKRVWLMRSFGYWTPKRQKRLQIVCLWSPHSTAIPRSFVGHLGLLVPGSSISAQEPRAPPFFSAHWEQNSHFSSSHPGKNWMPFLTVDTQVIWSPLLHVLQ